MNLFQQVKEYITMEQVARYCGLHIPRKGNVCCPFHDDHHPSLTLYQQNYHCWGCGAHGDAIDFTARHFQISQLQAAQKLIAAFQLPCGNNLAAKLNKDKKTTTILPTPVIKQTQEVQWQQQAHTTLHLARRVLLAADLLNDLNHPLLIRHHQQLTRIEYYLDCLQEDPHQFYATYQKEVEELAANLYGTTESQCTFG